MIISASQEPLGLAEMIVFALWRSISVVEMVVTRTDIIASDI